MKTYIRITALAFALVISTVTSISAQYTTHLRTVELNDYNQVKINTDVNVILKKSSRNQISFAGDSISVFSVEVDQLEGILTLDYAKTEQDTLAIIIIEYSDLKKITTGGTGTYYFPEIQLDNLVIINPEANIHVSGYTNALRIFSRKGVNNLTDLISNKMILQIGDEATLIDPSNKDLFTSLD